jgi:hypothetical protein
MSVTGVWLNERHSVLVLKEESPGRITGKYRSVVGRDANVRELEGRTSGVDGNKQMLGFAVCFHSNRPEAGFGHDSVCTWSGWARGNQITTCWLLTRSMSREQDEWSSRIVGQDTFQRVSDAYDEKHLTVSREALQQLLIKARKL